MLSSFARRSAGVFALVSCLLLVASLAFAAVRSMSIDPRGVLSSDSLGASVGGALACDVGEVAEIHFTLNQRGTNAWATGRATVQCAGALRAFALDVLALDDISFRAGTGRACIRVMTTLRGRATDSQTLCGDIELGSR